MLHYSKTEFKNVRLKDPVLAPRIANWLTSTIPAVIERTKETGRIDAFKLDWKPGMPNKPHVFWDSDVAKVLEGMAYALAFQPDPELEKIYDEWVDLIVSAQQPDGYLNTFFTVVEPENRWKSLCYEHELYCAGHLMEAAAAGFELLGKRKLLDCMCRYADYIDSIFGLGADKRRGWPGHEEIELALVKLYHATGNPRYRDLAAYFINDRGTEPNVFRQETESARPIHHQAQAPVREFQTSDGHAVRAVYLFSGMADVAEEENDESLLAACERLFDNICNQRMYLTGGIGSSFQGECFTCDYDLTNSSLMYAESCAAIGLAFFAERMFRRTGRQKYADTLERVLYNGVLSGISLAGDSFFYTNYLEVDDNLVCYNAGAKIRQKWFGCSCCPTSFARFLPQLGNFLYAVAENEIFLNIPAANAAEIALKDQTVRLRVEGLYPYDGRVKITLESDGDFTLTVRIPDWCGKSAISCNGLSCGPRIERKWKTGDVVTMDLDMPVEIVRSNSKITSNLGRVALQRGPVVYALEEIDQTCPVRELLLRTDQPITVVSGLPSLPAMTPVLEGTAIREELPADRLYSTEAPRRSETVFRAVPYALWQNRGATNMAVWMRESR